jgi:hypothetical protein
MADKIGFGTDGWRGVIAEDYTFDNVRRATQGFAAYLLEQGKQDQWVVVGHDKRSNQWSNTHPGHRFCSSEQESLWSNQHHSLAQSANG